MVGGNVGELAERSIMPGHSYSSQLRLSNGNSAKYSAADQAADTAALSSLVSSL